MKDHLRCLCGLLVAKVKEEGIEIKCRRCKRMVMILLNQGKNSEGALCVKCG